MSIQTDDTKRRAEILALMGDNEVGRVATAEGKPSLIEGDEYVDLENIGRGVQQVQASPLVTSAHMLPRSSVSDDIWTKIIAIVAR